MAVTLSVFSTHRDTVLAAGLDDFLWKPYRIEEIFDCMARQLGVRYIYEVTPPSVDADVAIKLAPEDVATLPIALRDELENAVVSLDRKRIMLLASRISEQNPSFGRALAHLAGISAYTPILQALERYKARFAQVTA